MGFCVYFEIILKIALKIVLKDSTEDTHVQEFIAFNDYSAIALTVLASLKKIKIWCSLVRFGAYFDEIVSWKNSLKINILLYI